MKRITLNFLYMEHEHVGKDVTCALQTLADALEMDPHVVSLRSKSNGDFPAEKDGIHYRFLRGSRHKGPWNLFFFWRHIWRNARQTDVLMRFHYTSYTMIEAMLYKWRNPRGRVYVKMDSDHKVARKLREARGIRKWLFHRGARAIDVVSCETSEGFRQLQGKGLPPLKDRLVFVPNGFDERLLQRSGIKRAEKENVMVTVGRLGTPQKNTEMLLDALAAVDLKEWKFYLIGPVEPAFQATIDAFFAAHPAKRAQVVFTGPITDKPTLWSYYNRAKVFVLTSRWESSALVLGEAMRFADYLVSTDVGAAADLIGSDKHGQYIAQEDSKGLAAALQRIVDGQTDTDVYRGFDTSSLSWDAVMRPVIEKLKLTQ